MSMSVKQAGRKGGLATKCKHGLAFLKDIGQKGGQTTSVRYKDKHSYWGKMGGRPRKEKLDCMEETPER
jgi:general stress protein YciG